MRGAIAVAVLAATALVVGCGSDDRKPEPLPLRSLVLQDSDLPGPFEGFASGAALRPDPEAGRRDDRTRFGRRGGWAASFRRSGSAATAGPLVVVSRVDEFGDVEGAVRQLAGYRSRLERLASARGASALALPRIGEETVGTVQTRRGGIAPARFFTVAWREGPLTASLRVSGFAGSLDARQVIVLARAQHERMARGLRSR